MAVQNTNLLNEDKVVEQIGGEAVLQVPDFGLGTQVAALADHGAVRSHGGTGASRFVLSQIVQFFL
jgi:hypothetical protein